MKKSVNSGVCFFISKSSVQSFDISLLLNYELSLSTVETHLGTKLNNLGISKFISDDTKQAIVLLITG